MKTFVELFSKKEFRLVDEIQSVLRITRNDRFSGNYQPYQIKANASLRQLSFSAKIGGANYSVNAYLKTLKLNFAIQVWEIANNLTERKFQDYAQPEWISETSPIKKLRFINKNRKKAEEYFLQALKDVCSSNKVCVSEGSIFKKRESKWMETDELELEVSIAKNKLTDEMMHQLIRHFSSNEEQFFFEQKNVRFSFDEISDFFVKTDEHLLSLLNAEDGRKLISNEEKNFFDHAERLKLPELLNAIKNGVDINAIDVDGETALTKVIKASKYDFVIIADADSEEYQVNNPDFTDDEKITIADKLINLGADINLFGYDGLNGLMHCSYQNNPVLMKFLLDKGANPNFNYFPIDGGAFNKSSALDKIYTDYHFISENKEEKVLDEMSEMLVKAGAKV